MFSLKDAMIHNYFSNIILKTFLLYSINFPSQLIGTKFHLFLFVSSIFINFHKLIIVQVELILDDFKPKGAEVMMLSWS